MLNPTLPASIAVPRSWGAAPAWRGSSLVRRSISAQWPDRGVRFVMAALAGIILSVSGTRAPSFGLDRSTPAWGRVVREIRAQGPGNCYEAAVTLAMEAHALGLENVFVVQGTLMGEGSLEGVRFGHSWVEADIPGRTTRVALDYSSGNSLIMDRGTYRFLQHARDVHEYSVAEAMSLAANGNFGPWTADVLAAWHP